MQQELRQNRIKKLEEIKKLGINPYPAKAERTATCQEIINNFDKFKDQKILLLAEFFYSVLLARQHLLKLAMRQENCKFIFAKAI